ncbi:MAG: asparagine synthase-related protein [Coprococcus sp.]
MPPDDILFRKKSPYPKTYDKTYEAILVQKMRAIMAETDSPIRQFLDTKKVERFLSSPSDYGKTLVWSVDGGAADDCLPHSGELLA